MSPQPISSMYMITMFGFVVTTADTCSSNVSTVNSIDGIILNSFSLWRSRIPYLDNMLKLLIALSQLSLGLPLAMAPTHIETAARMH